MTKKKLYSFADHPEHEAMLKPWADKWIKNALSTKEMDDFDKSQMQIAVKGMYEAAEWKAPRVVFVSSPFIARFAAGYAAAILQKKTKLKLKLDTHETSISYWLTIKATLEAIGEVKTAETLPLPAQMVKPVLSEDSWCSDLTGFKQAAKALGVGKTGLKYADKAWEMYQGGNFWCAWDAYLTFFRHIAKLDIDFSNYHYWELGAIHGSCRMVHSDFCIVSDRPSILKIDDQNRPHSETGPFCQWRDGTGLYYWHGTAIPAWFIEEPQRLTAQIALTWSNMEQRRAACEILGWAKILTRLDAKILDKDPDPLVGELLEVELPDIGKEKFLRVRCGTGREFAICVTRFPYNTAKACNAATYGWTPDRDIRAFIPSVRT